MVGRSISGTQKDVDTKSDSNRCVAMAADGLQLSTFRVSKDEPGRRWERHTISMRPPITLVKTFQIQETRIGAVDWIAHGVRVPIPACWVLQLRHVHPQRIGNVKSASANRIISLIRVILPRIVPHVRPELVPTVPRAR